MSNDELKVFLKYLFAFLWLAAWDGAWLIGMTLGLAFSGNPDASSPLEWVQFGLTISPLLLIGALPIVILLRNRSKQTAKKNSPGESDW
ncbi:MAG: hypothetical protein Athens041674_652 [Parcubacteria group bacterium Athens0416_74]|nr:MAG: hypothetical protein Athens041674_652 [Parcubacteria group bacterium Athens0416_74]